MDEKIVERPYNNQLTLKHIELYEEEGWKLVKKEERLEFIPDRNISRAVIRYVFHKK